MSEIDPESGATIPDNATAPFPNPAEEAMDYVAEARSHIIRQYRESPRLVATVEAFAAQGQAMEEQLVLIPPMDDPAIATGVNLDVTGELVGQGRVLGDGTVSSDVPYANLIASRIAYNKAIGSGPEFVAALEDFVFPGAFRFYDLGGMTIGIEVAGEPNGTMVALLDTGPVPRPMAVGVNRLWYNDANFFGFQGDPRPGLDGFGLESDLSLGGHLGQLF